jgi:hypothetical protein
VQNREPYLTRRAVSALAVWKGSCDTHSHLQPRSWILHIDRCKYWALKAVCRLASKEIVHGLRILAVTLRVEVVVVGTTIAAPVTKRVETELSYL